MPINASAKNISPRINAPAGTHLARCFAIVDCGTHDKEWQGKSRKKHEVRISWELPLETAVFNPDKGEQPHSIHKTYTLSLSEKAALRHDLENWRGRPFSEAELEAFDVAKLLGVPCQVTITHVEKNGNTYANVTAVTSVPKIKGADGKVRQMEVPEQVNASVEYSISEHNQQVFDKLPQFLKDIIQSSDEWKAKDQSGEAADELPMGDDADTADLETPF